MARTDLTPEILTDAIKNSHGILSVIQKKLNADYQTVKKYIDMYELRDLLNDERQRTTDLAEVGLLSHLKEKNLNAIMFQLNRDMRLKSMELVNSGVALGKVNIQVVDIETETDLNNLINA